MSRSALQGLKSSFHFKPFLPGGLRLRRLRFSDASRLKEIFSRNEDIGINLGYAMIHSLHDARRFIRRHEEAASARWSAIANNQSPVEALFFRSLISPSEADVSHPARHLADPTPAVCPNG